MPEHDRFVVGDWVTVTFWQDEIHSGRLLRVPLNEHDSYALEPWQGCYVVVAGKRGCSLSWRKVPGGLLEFRGYLVMQAWRDPSPKAEEAP